MVIFPVRKSFALPGQSQICRLAASYRNCPYHQTAREEVSCLGSGGSHQGQHNAELVQHRHPDLQGPQRFQRGHMSV